MEEKLYFKPGNYGKGRKKKQTEQKVDNAPEKKDHKAIKLISLLLFLLIVIIIIIWLLHGKTTTSGQYPANVRNESLTCESKSIVYEKVNQVNSDNKELKINMVFNGVDSLSSASIKYTLRYDSNTEAHNAAAIAHAQFNIGLQELGYDSSKFNNKISEIGSDLVITLNATSKTEINEKTASYFLLSQTKDGTYPESLSEYRQNYELQGFSCTSTIDNN